MSRLNRNQLDTQYRTQSRKSRKTSSLRLYRHNLQSCHDSLRQRLVAQRSNPARKMQSREATARRVSGLASRSHISTAISLSRINQVMSTRHQPIGHRTQSLTSHAFPNEERSNEPMKLTLRVLAHLARSTSALTPSRRRKTTRQILKWLKCPNYIRRRATLTFISKSVRCKKFHLCQ